ncbi:pectin methylesterase1 [Zea mays]|uniref:Pectin methylesterase1 n=1 Tax=Zea mays TaxID=4577 RepID=A0A1D6J7W5_MAIZE|nr:pectin methylesterase1 [Zea mays]
MAKALLGGLSAILVVAVVVGVVATVTRSGKKAGDNFTVPGEASLATSGKSVKSLCAPTLYKESCEKTLSQATNGTENPKEVFHSVAKVALESVQTAVEQSSWRAPSPTSSSQRGTCPGTATSPSRRSTTPSTTTAGPAPAPARGSTGPASTSSDGRRPSRSPPGRSSTAPCGSSTPARRTYLVSSSKGRMAWHTSHHI